MRKILFTIQIQWLISGLKESSKVSLSLSLENAVLLENIRKELGVTINLF